MRRALPDLDDRLLNDLHGRLTRLEGVAAGLAAQSAQRVLVLRSLRERLAEGTIERSLADLLFALERDASDGLESLQVPAAQRAGYVGVASTLRRLTGRTGPI